MRPSTQRMAAVDPTRHSFKPGLGYIDHGAPPAQVPHRDGVATVTPRSGAEQGSQHQLTSPGGSVVVFTWDRGVWHRGGGNRMAWTPQYLARHGWRYAGPI